MSDIYATKKKKLRTVVCDICHQRCSMIIIENRIMTFVYIFLKRTDNKKQK